MSSILKDAPVVSSASDPNISAVSEVTETKEVVTTPTSAATPAVEIDVVCPRCKGKLLNPGSLGWCRACGYSTALEEEDKKRVTKVAAEKKHSPLGILEAIEVIKLVPKWAWILVVGVLVVEAFSDIGNFFLLPPPTEDGLEESLARALWSTIQFGVAIICVIISEVWALLRIGPYDDKLGVKDLFMPGRLWYLVWNRLPDTRRQFWMGIWALALLKGAIMIGGGDYWLRYRPDAPKRTNDLLRNIAQMAQNGEEKSLEEAAQDLAATQGITGGAGKAVGKPKEPAQEVDTRPTVQCAVIGYLPQGDGISALIVAVRRGDQLGYAGIVRRGPGLKEPEREGKKPRVYDPKVVRVAEKLLKQMPQMARPKPVVQGLPIKATWVDVGIFCEVHHSGFDKGGILNDPALKEFMK